MSVLDLDRLKTIASFLRSQIGQLAKPAGLVQLNDEEAAVTVDALEEYILRERAVGNSQVDEWDSLRGFFRRHGMPPKRPVACLVCNKVPTIYPPRIAPKELPHIVVCDVCRAKAMTVDIAIRTNVQGQAMRVERVNEYGDPLSVVWQFKQFGPIKNEERLYEPGD
jgi:hypothetical protein